MGSRRVGGSLFLGTYSFTFMEGETSSRTNFFS